MSLIYYMKEVLGVKSIPQSLLRPEELEKYTPSSAELFFVAQDKSEHKKIPSNQEKVIFVSFKEFQESLFDVNTWGLFEKMASAMGLQAADYVALEIEKTDEAERFLFQQLLEEKNKRFVLFKQDPDRQGLLKVSGQGYIQTYSPSRVVKDVNLKKPVWDDLQVLMKDLSDEKNSN